MAKSIEEKADLLDFSRLLHRETGHCSLYHTTEQIHDLDNVLDQQIIRGAQRAIENQEEVNLDFAVSTQRTCLGRDDTCGNGVVQSLNGKRPGDKMSITYLRNKKTNTKTITLKNAQGKVGGLVGTDDAC